MVFNEYRATSFPAEVAHFCVQVYEALPPVRCTSPEGFRTSAWDDFPIEPLRGMRLVGGVNGPDFTFEQALLDRGILHVAGTDEVGRGPLAGPVVAAAVILDPARIPEGLNDSKKISVKKRDVLFDIIRETSVFCIAEASVAEIDALNIYHASHLAMCRAVSGLEVRAQHVLVDGNKIPVDLPTEATAIVKGDGKSQSIAAASILAKVTRDRHMVALSQQFPGYGWETNAGYPTKSHICALEQQGVTPHHRRTFKPVHNILCRH